MPDTLVRVQTQIHTSRFKTKSPHKLR